jgi:hypothetical protein
MQSFSIGSLALISGGLPVTGYTLMQPVDGLEGPPHRTNSFSRPGRHGAIVSSQYYDGRLITLTGTVSGIDYATYLSNRKALIAATNIDLDSNDYPIATRISFTMLDGNSYYMDVFFDKPTMELTDPTRADFQLTGIAPNPMIFGASQQVSSAISPPSGGGYIVSMIAPYISGAATGGSTVINNAGSETAWPVITLTGPLTNPVLTNTTTGEVLQLSPYTIGSGNVVRIDMDAHTITLNGASLIATKTATSDWWGLIPGNNNVSVTSTSSSDTGTAVFTYYSPYTGV